jgi:CBS domain-containing protein
MAATHSVTNGVTAGAKAVGAGLTHQAEAAGEALQQLARALRERLSIERVGELVSEGLTSAGGYLAEREPGAIGREIADLVRRYPLQVALGGIGVAVAAARWARRSSPRGGVEKRLQDVMTRHVEVVRPDAPLREAATKMADLDVGAIPVCDGDRLVGMLTDRDIAIRAVARGADPGSPVRETMTSSVRFCFEDEPVERAVETMKERKIRRLPILDRERHLIGIVALGDLAVDVDTDAAGDVLERVSSPARPTR